MYFGSLFISVCPASEMVDYNLEGQLNEIQTIFGSSSLIWLGKVIFDFLDQTLVSVLSL